MLFFCLSSRTSINEKEINNNKTGRAVTEMPRRDQNLVTPTGFPRGSVVKNPPAMQEPQVQSHGWEDTLKEGTGNSL